jgi:hypothetical protein
MGGGGWLVVVGCWVLEGWRDRSIRLHYVTPGQEKQVAESRKKTRKKKREKRKNENGKMVID